MLIIYIVHIFYHGQNEMKSWQKMFAWAFAINGETVGLEDTWNVRDNATVYGKMKPVVLRS